VRIEIGIGIGIEIGSTGEAFDNPDPDPVRSMVLHRKT
jgi:hypothetical protein